VIASVGGDSELVQSGSAHGPGSSEQLSLPVGGSGYGQPCKAGFCEKTNAQARKGQETKLKKGFLKE